MLDGLPDRFPPLRTLENRPTNLPVQPTPLVGREREVADVIQLLRRPDVRAVTLTGPGGTGKTRDELQAAAELVEDFPHGVFFVTLAAITGAELVLPQVAQTLGVNETAGQELAAYLAEKELLLVIDNLEWVLDAAPLLAQALAATRGVKLLTTSREGAAHRGRARLPGAAARGAGPRAPARALGAVAVRGGRAVHPVREGSRARIRGDRGERAGARRDLRAAR